MSMTMLTILQIAQALSAYTLVTLILPGIMLHKHLAEYKMSERLIGYFLAGNFYIIIWCFCFSFCIFLTQSHCRLERFFLLFLLFGKRERAFILYRR